MLMYIILMQCKNTDNAGSCKMSSQGSYNVNEVPPLPEFFLKYNFTTTFNQLFTTTFNRRKVILTLHTEKSFVKHWWLFCLNDRMMIKNACYHLSRVKQKIFSKWLHEVWRLKNHMSEWTMVQSNHETTAQHLLPLVQKRDCLRLHSLKDYCTAVKISVLFGHINDAKVWISAKYTKIFLSACRSKWFFDKNFQLISLDFSSNVSRDNRPRLYSNAAVENFCCFNCS